MGTWQKNRFVTGAVAISLSFLVSACGGGGGSSAPVSGDSGTPSSLTGIALPSEVSAVPASASGAAGLASKIKSLARSARSLSLPADSDYMKTVSARFVDEPTLEVFGIVETILKAVSQTHYADAENIGIGPYKAIVAWYEEQNGKSNKELETWIIQSDMVDGVNVVKVWISDDEGTIKVTVSITTAPTQNEAGDYTDYGVWTILADIDDTDEQGTFYASASVDSGNTVLRLSEDFDRTEDMGAGPVSLSAQTKAVLNKGTTSGYGKATIPDWEACWNNMGGGPNPCADGIVDPMDVKYAYDQNYLVLDEDSTQTVKYRNDEVEIFYRYGVFDGTTGQNVEAVKEFGFPLRYTVDGSTRHGYYGAWQGRHQLWAGQNGTLPDGTTVTKEVWGSDQTPESYTTKTFNGTLTKRSLVDATINQVKGIPVEIWLGEGFDMEYDNALPGWKKCVWEQGQNLDPDGHPLWEKTCGSSSIDLSMLQTSQESRKHVNIGREVCDDYINRINCQHIDYSYNADAGQFETQGGPAYGQADWQNGDRLWVWMGGSTYVKYTGDFTSGKTGWVELTLSDFDYQTWTPTFAEQTSAFDFPADREYYINNKGVNYVVKRTAKNNAAADFEVGMEIQTVVTPGNASTVLAGIDFLAMPWEDSSSRSSFAFDGTSLMLEYATVGSNDPGKNAGDVATQGKWGLAAYNGEGQILEGGKPVQFNWEYADPGDQNGWGKVTYLIDANSQYVYLDNPIMFNPVQLTPLGDSETSTFSLQFDGWMHGLPDMRWELQKNDFELSDDIKDKIVNIPAGTQLTETGTGKAYLVKPLEIGIILPTVSPAPAGAPDPAQANGLDLDFSVPTPTDIGALPTGTTLKYIEGKAASSN